jgi:transposase
MTQLFLGIDASKGYSDFVLIDAEKHTLDSSFQLDDNSVGHKALLGYLNNHLKSYPQATIYCGIESTGGYENNWFATLDRQNIAEPRIRVARVNPKGVTHTSKSELRRTTK